MSYSKLGLIITIKRVKFIINYVKYGNNGMKWKKVLAPFCAYFRNSAFLLFSHVPA